MEMDIDINKIRKNILQKNIQVLKEIMEIITITANDYYYFYQFNFAN